jgi:hypothetical protein
MPEFRLDCALPGGILPGDRWFDQTHDDTCSRCGEPIPDTDMPLLLYAGRGSRMLAYCTKCQERPDDPHDGNRDNVCDLAAERLVRGRDGHRDQAGIPDLGARGDAAQISGATAAPAKLRDERGARDASQLDPETASFLIWSNEKREWWGPDYIGYTADIFRAGRYRLDEATIICTNNNCALRPTDGPAVVAVMAPESLPKAIADCNRPGLTEDLATG